jgi:hypothetical protein
MSSPKLALTFRMFQNGQLIREDTLTQSVIKIGKVPSAHLQIADDAVSRMHAIVEVTGGEVSLIDLGSTRGSFVNGKKINKARLESGDVITLGDTRLELAIDGAGARPRRAESPALAPTASPMAPTAASPALDRAAPPAVPAVARRTTGVSTVISGLIDTGPSVQFAPPPVPPGASAFAPPAVSTGSSASAPPAVPPGSSASAGAPAHLAVSASLGPVMERGPAWPGGRAAAADAVASLPATAPVALAAPASRTAALPVDPVARPIAPPAIYRHAVAEAADEAGAARAVEVAALLGDSVVGVKHCIDPRSGAASPATWGLLAAGAACLVASAVAFTASVRTAGENHDRLETWTRVEHKPAYAFRPHRLGPGTDWVAFGGSALALVGLGLGVLRMRRERVSPYYRIGTAPGVELALEAAPAPAFPLVAPSGDGGDFVFNFAPGIDGELLLDGASTPFAALAAAGRARPSASTAGAFELAIPRNARIRARAGRATFMVSAVARPRRHAVPLLAGLERRTLAYIAGSLAAHLAIWAVLQLIPPDATGINVDLGSLEPITGHVVGTSPNDPPPPPPPDQVGGAGGDGAPSSPAMALPSGTSGAPDATDHGRLQIARTDAPPQMSHAEAVAYARRAGFLGDQLVASAIDTLAERADLASGFDLETYNGPLVGAYGEGPGNFGRGVRGFGAGGGCLAEPCGLIPGGGGDGDGRSPYTTIGRGPSAGDRYGGPGHSFGPHGHRPLPPTIGPPAVSGSGYDKSIIRRYIRRSIDKIGYCYEKQLLAKPDIAGDVTISFFISPAGTVQHASGTGFDGEVAACVAGVIAAIEFPKPGDGTGVQVNYPFAFHPSGR